jgi:DNA-binding phage protein
MKRTLTTAYDVVEHLRNNQDAIAYLKAGKEEGYGDAPFLKLVLEDIDRFIKIRNQECALTKPQESQKHD